MQNKVVPILIAVVIVAIVGASGYALLHKSSAPSTATSSATQTTTQSGAVVQTKNASNVGAYLADADGKALYTYGADTAGVSNCSGSCLESWPIYSTSNAPTALPANVTVIARADGAKQYAYKGMPLYTFTADTVGQVTGDNVANFHIAKP